MIRSGRRVARTRRLLLAPVFLVAAVTTAVPAAAQETVVSAGLNVRFMSGSFGSNQTTQLVYAPAMLRVDAGRFEVAGFFPYLTIDNGTVAPSQGGFVPMRGTVTSAPAVGLSMSQGSGMVIARRRRQRASATRRPRRSRDRTRRYRPGWNRPPGSSPSGPAVESARPGRQRRQRPPVGEDESVRPGSRR